jgi:hypothetical protein
MATKVARDVTLLVSPPPHKGHVFAEPPVQNLSDDKARQTTSWTLCSVRSDACRAIVL